MTETITVRSPYDNEVIGEIPAMTAADVDRAVGIAKQALHTNPLPLWKRAEILDKAAARLLPPCRVPEPRGQACAATVASTCSTRASGRPRRPASMSR